MAKAKKPNEIREEMRKQMASPYFDALNNCLNILSL